MPRSPGLAALAIVCVVGVASSASAEEVDAATRATARQLGEDGMRALDAGDCATAADRLWRAHDLVHVPTLAFYAGQCLEKLGRLIEAEEKYLEAMRDPVEPSAPPAVQAARVDAEQARNALLPRIPSVILILRPQLPDAVLMVDGRPVPPAMIGVKRPIDPGSHVAQVQRAGAVGTRPFAIREGESVTVDIAVPVQPAYGYPYGYPPQRGMMYPPPPPRPPPPPTKRRNVGLFIAGVVLAPIGGVTAIGGLIDIAVSHDSTAGDAILITGLGVMVGGIVMAAVGGKKVPIPLGDTPKPLPQAIDAPAATASFEPFVGPTSGVRVRF